ncbi:MAG: DUF5053 domain-containing protein [Prevotella sp.]|jgi:hypothetical protein|nr:DUF5053 domain-containing protein [Prevotella sp.]
MNLKEELKKIDQYIGSDTEKLKKQYSSLIQTFPEEKEQIDDYLQNAMSRLTENIGKSIDELEVKVQLVEISEIVSMSYIAKNYFKKTRQWLYKKINGSTVNGKPAKFTEKELETLNYAIQDISKKLGSTVISC